MKTAFGLRNGLVTSLLKTLKWIGAHWVKSFLPIAQAKKELEAFLHPKIRAAIEEESDKQDRLKYPYLIDIPLFFETASYPIKNSVVVYTPKTLQLERFMKRNGFSEEESLRRIESQMDIDEKRSRATWVIDNSSNLKHLQYECEQFVETIKTLYPAPKV